MVELFANSGDPDQTSHSVASDLGLHCLPVTHLGVFNVLKGIGTLSEEATLSNLFCLLSKNRPTLKEKNLLLLGANSFLFE